MKQRRLIFYNTIKALDDLTALKFSLKYQLAPIIMGFKPSMTINLSKNKKMWQLYEMEILKELGVACQTLREKEGAFILLFYKDCLIEALLEDVAVRSFLQDLDYPVHSSEQAIKTLKERYETYHCPHELGVFLGIALKDVKDYMTCPNKTCLLCGYWKVYNDLDAAQQTFNNYDLAKETMLNHLLGELEKRAS